MSTPEPDRAPAHYVAMGSSFGAGPGLKPRDPGAPRRSGRSAGNYAHQVAARLNLNLIDVTYSGATVDQLRHGGPNAAAPQVSAVTPDTSLVTITAGGNDVGYLPGLTLASLPALLSPLFRARTRVKELTNPDTIRQRLQQLRTQLQGLVGDIRDSAPSATVLIVGYLTILPAAEGAGASGMPATVADWGREVAERLSVVMTETASSTGAVFVDVGAASADHHAWSPRPWTNKFHYSLKGGAPYHPTQAGMNAVADLVVQHLTG